MATSKSKLLPETNDAADGNNNQDRRSILEKLFEDELKDIYWAEKALVKALSKMTQKATADDLVTALQDHLEETKVHVERIEQVFNILGKKAQAKKCEAMEGLIKEAEELMEEHVKGFQRDAAIISAGQKVEHYEIASYGTLRAFAEILELQEVSELLSATLDEEKAADEKLTEVTEAVIVL